MKKVIISMSIAAMSLMAADYSQMTMEELNAMRGTVPVEERASFQAEVQNRLQAMTPEERAAFRAERSQGSGLKQKLQDGSGTGKMIQKGAGVGMGQGMMLKDGTGANCKK